MIRVKWKTRLGAADGKLKRMIFGENSARLYKYKVRKEYADLDHDQLALMKEQYEGEGVARNNVAYGYVAQVPR